jgi:hypothetical protein
MDETTWAAVGVFVGVLAIWVALVAPRLEKHRTNAIDLRSLLGPMRKENYAMDRLDRAEDGRISESWGRTPLKTCSPKGLGSSRGRQPGPAATLLATLAGRSGEAGTVDRQGPKSIAVRRTANHPPPEHRNQTSEGWKLGRLARGA